MQWWRTGADALAGSIRPRCPTRVICDIRLPDRSGADDLSLGCPRSAATPPFLFITGYGDIEQAVSLMREGARDYLTKPFVMSEFLLASGSTSWHH